MKILFIGTVEFSYHLLETLIEENSELIGVISDTDNHINSDYVDLKPICDKNKIPCLLSQNINSPETLSWIKDKSPDIIFCFGWSQLIKEDILKIPHLGVIGYHPAELPKNRGRHPIIWALALGLKKTASTFFYIDEGADTGNLIDQRIVLIEEDDDAKALYSKLIVQAKKQLKDILPIINNKNYHGTPQDDSLSNYWRKRSESDGQIDWRMSADKVHKLVKALSKPYIGAHFISKNIEYKVWKSKAHSIKEFSNFEPGKIFKSQALDKLLIKCGDGAIELIETEPKIDLMNGSYL